MPACHAGGHEFEPRTHRWDGYPRGYLSFFMCVSSSLYSNSFSQVEIVFVTRLVLWTHWPTGSNYRISFHTDGHGYSRKFILSRICEFSNYSLSYGESRNVTGHEFANYLIFLHTEFHGASRIYISCHEFANSIIRDKEKHPWSSVIIRVIKKNSTIRKFVI